MDTQRFQTLFNRYMKQAATLDEEKELMELLADPSNETESKSLIETYWLTSPEKYDLSDDQWNSLYNEIQQAVKQPAMRVNMFSWRRWAVAASIILAVGIGSYFLFFNSSAKQPEIVKTTPQDVKAPATNRASIKLADGKIVYLDSAVNGTLANENNVQLVKLDDGKIIYSQESGVGGQEIVYNTLTNPRGSKVIDMTLADGSRVWLNAGSSVTYPVAFVGNDRRVSMTGEAYFEISHDAGKPFVVSKGETSVTVLGTHFNVNAYDDEDNLKVTLLEGSVEVKRQTSNLRIKPGEQAVVSGDIEVKKNIDIDAVMAWKNGKFSFADADLRSIMRQLMRWYDVDVVYENNISERHFTADISRDKNLSSLLKILEASGIHFRIEGKKLTVIK